MIGIYFSGTGNTRHCVEEFVKYFDGEACSVENPDCAALLGKHERVVLGFPVYFSNIPKILRDFIDDNALLFYSKKIFIIATMGLFSGDGAGCAARLLEKHGAEIMGGLHLKMPDCIGDEKVLKKSPSANKELIKRANEKIGHAAGAFKSGESPREGLSIWHRFAGLLGQRLWFYGKTASYKKLPHVDTGACTGCGRCAAICPMQNMAVVGGKAVSGHKCTMCYRCFSRCPAKALTILGRKVYVQYNFESFQ